MGAGSCHFIVIPGHPRSFGARRLCRHDELDDLIHRGSHEVWPRRFRLVTRLQHVLRVVALHFRGKDLVHTLVRVELHQVNVAAVEISPYDGDARRPERLLHVVLHDLVRRDRIRIHIISSRAIRIDKLHVLGISATHEHHQADCQQAADLPDSHPVIVLSSVPFP